MKLLLINQTFHPDVVATAQQLTDFALELAKTRHEVTVLTARRGYSEPHPIFPSREIYHGVRVVRVWPFHFGRKSRLTRILDALCLNLAFSRQLFWLGRFDKVIAMTSPPLIGWVALLFAKLRGSKFITWMMDLQPDEAIAAGWISAGSLRAKILEAALKFVLRRSDKIIVLDSFMKERLIQKGASPRKIEVLPPWSHDEDLETIEHEKNSFRAKHKLQDKFVIMYSGNLSVCHPLDTLLKAALLLKKDPSAIFVFVGGGERVKDVLSYKEKYDLSNILYFPYQERSQIKYSLSAADLHAVVMGEPFVGIVHPCKIYGILRIGRPFVYVGPRESAIGEIVASGGVGYRVSHGESEKLVDIIHQVKRFDASVRDQIQRKEMFIAQRFSRQVLSKRLAELLLEDVGDDN